MTILSSLLANHELDVDAIRRHVYERLGADLEDCPPPYPHTNTQPATTTSKPPLAAVIDHTLLSATTTRSDIHTLCIQAIHHQFAAVCVNSQWVSLCASRLSQTPVTVCSVVGFPLGAMSSAAKAFEANQAIADGAGEIDTVMALGALRANEFKAAFDDVCCVVRAATPTPVKIIIETGALTPTQIVAGAAVAQLAGAAFIKTSTGFGPVGATVDAVRLIRRTIGPRLGIKASGGIRTAADAYAMIAAGATRIGASTSVAIMTSATSATSLTAES